MAYTIEVDLSRRTLTLLEDEAVVGSYPVAIGKPATPTPTGRFRIAEKARVANPVYGGYWLGLDRPGYGIHGTNAPSLIGRAVSGGCIRMRNRDVAELFDRVPVGTPVVIHP